MFHLPSEENTLTKKIVPKPMMVSMVLSAVYASAYAQFYAAYRKQILTWLIVSVYDVVNSVVSQLIP